MNLNRSKNDDDWDDEEPGLEALSGAVSAAGGMEETAGLLLEMLCGATKLRYLLLEADEIEFRSVAARLASLQAAIAELPTVPKAGRKVGFKVDHKKRRQR